MSRHAYGRRGFLLLAAGGLAGCGFHPVYAPDSAGDPGPARTNLAAINVNLLPDRAGQLLRQALQRRLEGSGGSGVAKKFDLSVQYGIGGEGIAILPDNSTTRVRFVANATYTLQSEAPDHHTVTSGNARSVDALNVINSQYFASDLETEQIQVRLAEAIADQITLQLASYFDQHPTAA